MACCVEEDKNDKSFNDILEDLDNEETVEMLSEGICNDLSIHSLCPDISCLARY